MRILLVNRSNFILGGVETYLRALIPLLRQRGHEVALAYEHTAEHAALLDPDGDTPGWRLDGEGGLRAAQAWQPDVAYVHGLGNPDVENVLLDRFPAVAYLHNYASTCISGTKTHSFPASEACDRKLGPMCLALYLPRACGGRNPLTMLRRYGLAVRGCAALARYERVLVANKHMFDECRKNGISAARVRIVSLFAPHGDTRTPEPPPRGKVGTRVLFIGRLTPVKGVAILVEALALSRRLLPQPLQLDVAGDGSERGAIETIAKRLGVDVQMHGWLPREGLAGLIEKSDALAMPSLWPEPFGLVGIEAAAGGLPSVGFATGGIPAWLRPGVTGEIAPSPPTARGLADALARALGNADHLDALRAGAWRMAREFSSERHVHELEAVLDQAAGSRRRMGPLRPRPTEDG